MNKLDLVSLFAAVLKPDNILSTASDLLYYGKDSCKQYTASPSIVLLPESEQQVQSIVRLCNQHRLAIVPSGGRTGYSGGATATGGEVVLSLTRMNKVVEVNSVDMTMRCEGGVTTEAVRNAASRHNLFYPVDFASRGSSHIAGNVATNAGGIRVIRYGNTRDWVLGLRVVTASGEALTLNGPLFKNQTGYDLRGMFIGSEGTLGIITEVTLKLTSPPGDSSLALVALEKIGSVLEVLNRTRQAGLLVNVFEYFEYNALALVTSTQSLQDPFSKQYACYALIEIELSSASSKQCFTDLLARLLENEVVADVVVAENSKHTQHLMSLRERISESIAKVYVPHKNDISVPVSKIPAFIETFKKVLLNWRPVYEVIVFGHIGDGNLHLNVLKPAGQSDSDFFSNCEQLDERVFELVASYSGSISAEHGVGLLKRKFLHFSRSKSEIEIMQGIKKLMDPSGILNPGKIFQ